ncbi:hypothetical protein L6452_39973 [Arctium lappa]|uniref:Uncharacterized protein n=1 Tax=Arctium lappa TaxID=4217 RepID=A0ACB8XTU7_ARCLA|nr:hypothetical protein L6452_39973 [Arctium lappa]
MTWNQPLADVDIHVKSVRKMKIEAFDDSSFSIWCPPCLSFIANSFFPKSNSPLSPLRFDLFLTNMHSPS